VINIFLLIIKAEDVKGEICKVDIEMNLKETNFNVVDLTM
jgi:hypothetical protein